LRKILAALRIANELEQICGDAEGVPLIPIKALISDGALA
jgi:hypothetical protein